jgi:predicted nucleic acid-binding protein
MADLVLIDTCIWAPFFAKKKSLHKSAVAELLDQDTAAIIGPILAEVLLGFTKDAEADWVASALAGVQYLELPKADWRAAAKLGRHLASDGHFLPFPTWPWRLARSAINILCIPLIPISTRYQA